MTRRLSKPLTPIEIEVLEYLLTEGECKGPDQPERTKPLVLISKSVIEQLVLDKRLRSWPCALCSTGDGIAYHGRVTSVGRLALRMARLT